jgi:hypothetical protein
MRQGWRALVAGVGLVAVGCAAGHHQVAAHDTTTLAATTTTSNPATTGGDPSTTSSTTPSTTVPPTSTTLAPRPVLGVQIGTFSGGSGFGQVEPKDVSNGGDPTGTVSSIAWQSWGGAQAVGTGLSDYVASGQTVAAGTTEPVRIVAFDPGTCDGRYMYAAVEWYFPQHGQGFDPDQFEDICIGAYYPVQTGLYQDGGDDGGVGIAHYALSLSGSPDSLSGSVKEITATGASLPALFGFHGQAAVDGTISLLSAGPFEPGHTFTGTWQTLGLDLHDCLSYLAASPKPSCMFYWSGVS